MKEKYKSMPALVWLGLASLLTFLAGGDTPVELAVWLSPVFWLRFFRMSNPLKGVLFAFPCMILAAFLSFKGMVPLPLPVFIITTIIDSAVHLLPYLLDRLLAPKLQGAMKTLLLPAFVVAIGFLLFLGRDYASWGIYQVYGIQDIVWLQLTSVTGIWGIMFLIYWTASVINEAWSIRKTIKVIRRLLISFVVILIVIYGYGVFRLHETTPIEHSVRMAGITPTPAQREALKNVARSMISENAITDTQTRKIRSIFDQLFLDLVNKSIKVAQSGVEMVVWSEGAAVIFARDEDRYIRQARLAAKEHGIYLGLAVIVVMDNMADLYKNSQPFFKNKLIFILPDGNIAWEHMKAKLVPGMEDRTTIPGEGILKTVKVPVVPVGHVTGAICFELDFPQLIRQAGKSGSSLLLAPANDWAEIKHIHAAMARIRAIENGLAIFRPTSEGISIAVDPYGRIVSQGDYFLSRGGPLVAVLPVKSVSTLYSSLGDLFAWIVLIGVPVLLIVGIVGSSPKIG